MLDGQHACARTLRLHLFSPGIDFDSFCYKLSDSSGSRLMKLLMVTTEFPPHHGGVATLAYEQARGLAALGVDIEVLTILPKGIFEAPDTTLKVRPLKCRAGAIWRLMPLFFALLRHSLMFRPQFIHCPTYRGFGLPVFAVNILLGIRYCIYLHGTEVNTEVASCLRKFIMKTVLSRAAFVGTNSHNTAALTKAAFPKAAIQFVPLLPGVHMPVEQNGCEGLRSKWLTALTGSAERSEGVVILLAVCRMVLSKGVDTVVRALSILLERRPELPVFFVGIGGGEDLEHFRNLVAEKHLSARVLFPGSVPYGEAAVAYSAADIYVQPSKPAGAFLESFGISFLEAQAAGLPCIGSRWGGVPEAVQDGTTALLIEPGNDLDLSRAIERLCDDVELRTRMGAAARERALSMSWKCHSEKLKQMISSCLG